MAQNLIDNIIKEAQRIEEDTIHSAKGHLYASKRWGNVHYVLGILMIVFASFASAEPLYNSPKWAYMFAIIAAILGSVQTFINAEKKSSSHYFSGNNYLTLEKDIRIFRTIDLFQIEEKQAIENLKSFSDKRNILNTSSLTIPHFAYTLAKKDIDKGCAQYKVDKKES